MNNKKNISGFLLSALAAILFLQPATTFALTDLEKCQNEKTALELELQREGDKVKAAIDEKIKALEVENQKRQAEIDAKLIDKEKELSAAKAETEAAKKETEATKKDVETAKKETEAVKKDVEAAKKDTEAARKDADAAKKDADAAKKDAEAAKKNAEAAKKEADAAKKTAADNESRLKALQQSCNEREKTLQDRIKELETQLQNQQNGVQNKTDVSKDQDAQQYSKEKIASLEAAIEDLNAQLEECKDRVRNQKEKIDKLESQKKDFKKELKGEIKDGNIRMPDSKGRIVININDRISFDPGSATLKGSVYPALNKIIKILKNYPEHKILVAGHTDSDPITKVNFKDNKELSEARANAVLDYLLKNTNLDKSLFQAKGCGEKRPVAKNDTPANKALNRRVDIIVVTADKDLPDDTEDEGSAK